MSILLVFTARGTHSNQRVRLRQTFQIFERDLLGTRQGPALSPCKSWGGTAQITTQGHRGTFFSGGFQIFGDRGTQLLRAIRLREDHSSRGGGPRSETTQFMSEVDRFLTGKSPKCLQLWPLVSYPRLCSDGAPQTTHDISMWEN